MPSSPPPKSSRQLYRLFRKTGPRPESYIRGSHARNEFRQALTGFSGQAGGGPAEAPLPKLSLREAGHWMKSYVHGLRPHVAQLLLVAALTVVTIGVGLFVPYASKLIIDGAFTQQPPWTGAMLHAFGLTVIFAILVAEGFNIWRDLLIRIVGQRLTFHYRQDLYEHVQRLPLRTIQDMKTGGIIARIMGDVDNTAALLQQGLIGPATNVVRVLATLFVLLWIDWRLTLVAGIMLPFLAGLNLLMVRKVRPIHRDISEDKAQISARLGEVFGGIRVVRSFRRERSESLRFAMRNHLVIRKGIYSHLWTQAVTVGWRVMIPVTGLCIVWYGAARHLTQPGGITIGELIAFQLYMLNLLYPVSQIVGDLSNLQSNIASLERIEALLKQPVEPPDPPEARPIARIEDGIEWADVHFSYRAEVPVLNGVSVKIPAGTSLALVGPSGAGKSTLADLLARFYEPTAGQIRVDERPLSAYRREDYRKLIAVVQQDTFLFDGTIAENIAYGRRNATQAEIQRAAQLAHCHEFVMDFPDGYDTYVGERGVRLSGGQKQRIAIARAILADPQLLILDEATSSLDSESEAAVQEGLATLMKGRTSLVIAHRLSTISNCTQIAVLEEGRIVELGAHADLIAHDARYAELVRIQTRDMAFSNNHKEE